MNEGNRKPEVATESQKVPVGPNFGLIVGLSCAALLVIIFGAYFLFRADPKLVPKMHGPSQPSSLARPADARPSHGTH